MAERLLTLLARTEVWIGGLSLAAFLALFWLLRGTLPGRRSASDETGADVSRRADRAAATAVAGVVLVALGGLAAVRAGIPWAFPFFGLGYGLLLLTARRHREARRSSPVLRRVVHFAESALSATLLAGVLIVGNVLAFKYAERPIDFTSERSFTLASLTVSQLKSLKQPLRFVTFFGRGPASQRQLDRVTQLLDLYKAENPRLVSHDVLNPFADTVRFTELAERLPDVNLAPGGGVVLEYGEGASTRRLLVRNTELFDIPREATADPARFTSNFRGEDALTSALIRLREGVRPKVGFTKGHGEGSIYDADPNRPGLGLLRGRLEAIGMQPVEVSLLREDMPQDVPILFIAAPQSAFEPAEAERLKRYVARGGHAVLLLDGRKKTGLELWIGSFHVEVIPEPIFDLKFNLGGRAPGVPYATAAGQTLHSIVQPLQNQYVVVPAAVPLNVIRNRRAGGEAKGRAPNPSAEAVPILWTSQESWAESDSSGGRPERNPGKDRAGPFAVGAAIAEGARGRGESTPRLVVFSSPLLADNRFVTRQANMDLLVNAVSWLRGRPDIEGIAAKPHTALTLTVAPDVRARLVLLPTLLAVVVIVGLGILTYFSRRA